MRRKRQMLKIDESIEPDVETKPMPIAQPRVRTYAAKQCSACSVARSNDPNVKATDNFTRVFATRGNVRYCRCDYCKNTWKDYA
jgi:hypothetical protein